MTSPRDLTESECCPECGERIEPESEACGRCGFKLFDVGPGDSHGTQFRQGDDERNWDPIESLDDQGDLRPPPEFDFSDLVAVFEGTMSEAMTHRAALGARGYETYIRDDNTKVMDPFITGGYAFSVSLDAPKDKAVEIREILDGIAGREQPREKSPAELEIERVDKLGRSVILCAIFLFSAPIGVVQFARYFVVTLGLKRPRPDWVWVAICGLLCLALCLFVGYVVYWLYFGDLVL